jgi:ligand-binding sensor domain-containing protein
MTGAAMKRGIAMMLLVLASSTAHAQSVERVVTATADARELVEVGERTLVATEGGLVVLREGRVERVLGPREGLPGARLRSVSATDEGVWVGAVEGTALVRVGDEVRVERTLPLRRVRRAVRLAGHTWMASYGDGLHRVDGARTTPVRLGDAHAYVRLTDLAVRGDELWVATSGVGILRVGADGRVRGRLRARDGLPSDYVWRLVGHGDRLLVATIDGVAEVEGERVARGSAIARAAQRLPVRDVRDVALRGEDVWLGTWGRGVWRVHGTGVREVRGSFTQVNDLATTEEGLFVAHAGGVQRVDRAQPMLAGGLPSGDVSALARAFGTLWAGTFTHGLARLREGAFEVHPSAHGRFDVDRRINDLIATGRGNEQRLWIATDRGLYWHDGRVFAAVDDPAGPGRVHVTALHAARDGALWVTSGRALCRHRRDRWRCWSGDARFPVMQLHAVTTDARGQVWVGSLHGLYRFDPARGTFTRHTVSSGALPVDWVTAVVPWGDGVLAGTYHGGLALREGERFRIVREGQDGLPSGWVNPHALSRIGDEVWIGTLERGLVIGRPGAWRRLTTAEGLPSDDVTDVLADDDGVWVATRGGLARLTR